MNKRHDKAAAFKAEIEEKIQKLIAEFAGGTISREQFNLLYDRYNGMLSVANDALAGENSPALSEVQNSVPTIAIREATTGKAIGMAIYHHRSGRIIETLGGFDVPAAPLAPVLNEISGKIDSSEFVEPMTKKLQLGSWLLYITREFTTVIVLVRNEPSPVQIRDMQRLHHDFEVANKRFLSSDSVDVKALAYPFLAFVQRKLGK